MRMGGTEESVVYLAYAYSALAQSKVKNHDMVSDTGADRFIFHSINRFINLDLYFRSPSEQPTVPAISLLDTVVML